MFSSCWLIIDCSCRDLGKFVLTHLLVQLCFIINTSTRSELHRTRPRLYNLWTTSEVFLWRIVNNLKEFVNIVLQGWGYFATASRENVLIPSITSRRTSNASLRNVLQKVHQHVLKFKLKKQKFSTENRDCVPFSSWEFLYPTLYSSCPKK